MATDYEKGVVSAGAVGMDINCGVSYSSNITADEMSKETLAKILQAIAKEPYRSRQIKW